MIEQRIQSYLIESKNKFNVTLPEFLEKNNLNTGRDLVDYYITYVNVLKFGINPRTKFNTPLGVYAYPLFAPDIYDTVLVKKDPTKVPYAGDAKYILLFENKSPETTVYSRAYPDKQCQSDIKKILHFIATLPEFNHIELNIIQQILRDKTVLYNALVGEVGYEFISLNYNAPYNPLLNQALIKLMLNYSDVSIDIFDKIVFNILENIHGTLVVGHWRDFTNFNRLLFYPEAFLSLLVENKRGITSTKTKNINSNKIATLKLTIYSKVLGYTGLVDLGTKSIHPNEPEQALFFNTRSLDLVSSFINNYDGTLYRVPKAKDNEKPYNPKKVRMVLNPYNNVKTTTTIPNMNIWKNKVIRGFVNNNKQMIAKIIDDNLLTSRLAEMISFPRDTAGTLQYKVKVDKVYLYFNGQAIYKSIKADLFEHFRQVYVDTREKFLAKAMSGNKVDIKEVDIPLLSLSFTVDDFLYGEEKQLNYYLSVIKDKLDAEVAYSIVNYLSPVYRNYIHNKIQSQLNHLTPYIIKASHSALTKALDGPANKYFHFFENFVKPEFKRIINTLFKGSTLASSEAVLEQLSTTLFLITLARESNLALMMTKYILKNTDRQTIRKWQPDIIGLVKKEFLHLLSLDSAPNQIVNKEIIYRIYDPNGLAKLKSPMHNKKFSMNKDLTDYISEYIGET